MPKHININAAIGFPKNMHDKRAYFNSNDFAAALADGEDGPDGIVVTVNSVGGNVVEGNAIINAMQKCTVNVTAQIDALAASMGYFICLGANEIKAYKNSLIMLHSVQGSAEGSPEEIEAEVEVLKKFRQSIAVTLATRLGKTTEEVTAEFLGEDKWFTAEEALAAKLIDAIVDAETQTSIPDAAANRKTYGEVVAEWQPAPVEANINLYTSLSNEERWFYDDLFWAQRSSISSAQNVLKSTNNQSIIADAKAVISNASTAIVDLVKRLYGAETDATAKAEEWATAVEAAHIDKVTAKANPEVAAKLKNLTAELSKKDAQLIAANTQAATDATTISELKSALAKLPEDPDDLKKKGTEGGTEDKYASSSAKYNK